MINIFSLLLQKNFSDFFYRTFFSSVCLSRNFVSFFFFVFFFPIIFQLKLFFLFKFFFETKKKRINEQANKAKMYTNQIARLFTKMKTSKDNLKEEKKKVKEGKTAQLFNIVYLFTNTSRL